VYKSWWILFLVLAACKSYTPPPIPTVAGIWKQTGAAWTAIKKCTGSTTVDVQLTLTQNDDILGGNFQLTLEGTTGTYTVQNGVISAQGRLQGTLAPPVSVVAPNASFDLTLSGSVLTGFFIVPNDIGCEYQITANMTKQ